MHACTVLSLLAGIGIPNSGSHYPESVYPGHGLWNRRQPSSSSITTLSEIRAQPRGFRSCPGPSFLSTTFLGQAKDCSTHVDVKMWILIIKIVFCKYSYINLSAHSLVQIYTDMIYTDVICTTEQNKFNKHLLLASGLTPAFFRLLKWSPFKTEREPHTYVHKVSG